MFAAIIKKSVIAVCAVACCCGAFANNVSLRPAKPTHILFVPTANVNPAGDLVLGFHEVSYALPGNLQLQLSIIDNIGKVMLGAKYGLAPNMAIGGGYASTLVSMAEHGIPRSDGRLGLFFTYDFENTKSLGMGITPHTQIGSNGSVGIDFGLRVTPDNFWSFLWEAGASVQMWDGDGTGLYLYTFGALRVHPPTVPFLFVTLGVGTKEVNVEDPGGNIAKVFFDVMVCFKTN